MAVRLIWRPPQERPDEELKQGNEAALAEGEDGWQCVGGDVAPAVVRPLYKALYYWLKPDSQPSLEITLRLP